MQSFPEITSSSIFTPYFWESLLAYIQQSLPPVKWSEIFSGDFWKKSQNVINLYFYLGIGSVPINFLYGFFGTVQDEKRVSVAFETIFKISMIIIPAALGAIYLLLNGYFAIIKTLRGL